MAVTNEPTLTIRAPYPVMIQKGRAVTARLEALLDGAAVALDSATYTLTSPSGTNVLDAVVATTGSGTVTYAIGATVLDDYDPGHRWTEKWVLTFTAGPVRPVRREAALIAYELPCPLAQADILKSPYPDLVDHLSGYSSTPQDYIDEAWGEILEMLFEHEDFPFLIVSASALRRPLKNKCLADMCRFMWRTQADANKWEGLAKHHEAEFLRAWDAKTYLVDRDSDGEPDSDQREGGASIVQPMAYTSGTRSSGRF